VSLQPNAVIGGDGFGYLQRGGSYRKKPQVGRVVVGDDVEIGANTTVDRGSIGETRIGRGTKIDNLVQVAHNVTVGENVILVAQVGVAGSTSIGDGSIMAGQSGAADHLTIGSGVVVGARAGVMRDVPDGMAVHGFPAVEGRTWLKQAALIQALPELRKRITELEARLKAMEAQRDGL
jgi:UDP-3-O-[3-hydroxymyristoyl] glucosamine N-acyltransferase